MSRIICVLLSLSMVFTFAETDNLKETTKLSSEIKLPKEDGFLQNQLKTTNGEFEKTIQRNLAPAKSKKEKTHIVGGLSKETYQQRTPSNKSKFQEQDFKPEKILAKSPAPTLVGPRPSIADRRASRNIREHETLFFSEYAEGSSNHKYLEIYNPTNETIDLSGYAYPNANNGGTDDGSYDYWNSFDDGATIAPGGVYIVAHGSSDASILALANETHNYLSNGDDGYCLVSGGTWTDADEDGNIDAGEMSGYEVIDCVGDFGADPGSGWSVAGESNATKDHTLVRKPSVVSGNGGDWVTSAGTTPDDSEWVVYDQNTWTYLGSHEIEQEEGPYLTEGFEGGLVPPSNWSMVSLDEYGYSSSLGWEIGPGTAWYDVSTPNSGDYCAFFDVYNLWYDHESTLISPAMDLSGATAPILSFAFNDGSGVDFVEVLVSIDAGVSFTSVFNTPTSTLGWEVFDVNLSQYVGEQAHVAFKMVSDYGSSNPAIDDIVVQEAPTYPIAEVSTTELDFGEIAIGSSKTLSFSVLNSGGGPLTWNAASDNSDFVLDVSSGTLSSGETGVISVTYTAPDADGLDEGNITITHDADSSPDVVMVKGSGHNDLYRTGFEDAWAGDPASPSDWSQITVNGVNPWYQYVSSFQAYSGEACAAVTYSSSHSATNIGEHLLVSPAFDLTGGAGYNLTFYLRGSSSWQTDLKVQISSQNTEASTGWTDLATYIYNENMPTSWTEQVIDLSAYNDGTYYIGFRSLDQNGNYVRIDDLAIEAIPATPTLGDLPASGLVFPATAIGESRVQLITLTNSGLGELTGDITYPAGFSGPATFSTSTSVDVEISYSPTTAGIHSGSVSITSNGGDGTITVSGNAGGSVATWDDDFDGDGEADWPIGWDVVDVNGGYEWEFGGGTGAHTGDGYAYKYYESGSDDWLISPMLDVAAGDMLTFYARSYSSSWLESMNIMLSTTGGGDPSSFDVTLGTDPAVPLAYTAYEYDLSSYAGTQVRVAIQCTSDNMFYLYVDDIATSAVYQTTGPLIYDYPGSVNFGTVSAGEANTFTWDYFNTGGSDLEVTAVTFSDGPFALSSESTLPVVTTPGGIGSFDVTFSPPAGFEGEYSATMTVSHNSGADIVVPLSGYGIDAVYVESFDPDADGNYSFPIGWVNIEDGGGSSWTVDGIYGLRHGYNSTVADNDTALSVAIDLPAVDGYYYEVSFSEWNQWGTYAEYCGVSITTDGGQSFTPVFESLYENAVVSSTIDLTGFSGTVHLAFVYIGTDGNNWGIDDIVIRSKPEPIIPILATSSLGFPATAIGETSTKWLYFMNIGAGEYSGSITYPDELSGETNISGLANGEMDSIAVTYSPTAQGIFSGALVFDGSSSNAAEVSIYPEANSGIEVGTFEEQWIGWDDYSLAGAPYNGTPDTWLYFIGDGHNSDFYTGVYSYEPYWGGVNDFLVSPKLEVETGDVFSFWAQGGYFDGVTTPNDSMVVWVSSEAPEMGANEEGLDTGFVNTDAFTMLGEGTPPFDTWGGYNYDLSNHVGDAWLLIQSVKAGWMLKVDDVAYPGMYMNPNPVLYVGTEYDFGVTQPTGDSVRYYLRNTGSQDLVIDDMEFAVGEYFDVEYNSTFPITILPGGIDSIDVYFMPEMEGVVTDTLIYYSNYTVGDYDAYGRGTDRSVFIAEAFNAPPSPVALIGPADETVLTIDGSNAEGQTGIFWTNSSDPDGYPIEYFLELVIENTGDTLDTLISQSNFFLSHGEVLEYMTEVSVTQLDISWNVYAYDGFEDVESSNGPWSLTIDGGWALSVDNNTLPEVFALHNNYPNPFNPITNIRYDVPELSDVKIDIYNVAGSKIKTLVSKQHQPGRYKIQWNATNEQGAPVATGMYIYKIRANDFVSVKKLLLMK